MIHPDPNTERAVRALHAAYFCADSEIDRNVIIGMDLAPPPALPPALPVRPSRMRDVTPEWVQ